MTRLQIYRTSAYWYALGIAHATGEPERSAEFADFVALAVSDFDNGRTHHLPAVDQMWKDFSCDLPSLPMAD